MDRTHSPEITFTVHPRPEIEEPIGHADPVPPPPKQRTAPERNPAPEEAIPPAVEFDASPAHRDTLIGDLVFLARFAFGRY